jgi:hypothetical protein
VGGGVHVRMAWGCVAAKMFAMKLTVDGQAEEVNFDPLEMTKCSKECVPERASCSWSVKRRRHSWKFDEIGRVFQKNYNVIIVLITNEEAYIGGINKY